MPGSFRLSVRERLGRLRRTLKSRSPGPSKTDDWTSDPRNNDHSSVLAHVNQSSFDQNGDLDVQDVSFFATPPEHSEGSAAGDETEQETAAPTLREDIPIAKSDLDDLSIEVSSVSSDIWSTAYREAVDNLGKDIDVAILKGDNVAELFKQLEKMEKDNTQESAFVRGVKYLHSLQVPLERFKLALDLASPLTSIEPTTSAVFGVVRSVTALAISFSTADASFAKQIGELLENLSYIDECDTLGQRSKKDDIHKALVSVYQKLLEFYNVAYETLTRKGAKFVLRIILQNGRLPELVQEFLKHAELLRKLVEKATWEIVEDIKAMLYDHDIANWLGSDKTTAQSQRHAHFQELRADQACDFLLTDPAFTEWYKANDSKQLVIVGEMGSGKSVAMAFLVDELRRRSGHQLPQPKICYHYCQNGASGEKVHILCVLVLSLLQQLPGLKRDFHDWCKRKQISGITPSTDPKALEEWLQGTLATIDRPLVFVIDALDECNRYSREQLLISLRSVSEKTTRLKILFSTRPENEILEQLDGMGKIAMECNAARDRIIVEKTVETRLPRLASDVKAAVIEALSRSAHGSAIWTKMTVELIEIRGIRALAPMRAFLNKMPQPRQLWELYASLYSRYTEGEPENRLLATTALEILAVAQRPLSLLELSWAVALGAADASIHTVDALSQLVDHERLIPKIQPFLPRLDHSDLKKRQVKLVHQSVKEFILASPALLRPGPTNTSELSPATSQPTLTSPATPLPPLIQQQRIEELSSRILSLSIRYLLLHEIGQNELFPPERLALDEMPCDLDLFEDDHAPNKSEFSLYCTWEKWEEDMVHYDPIERGLGEFFVYASCHWNEHYGAVSTPTLLPSLADIKTLCHGGSIRIYNWTAQNCRPDCAVTPRFPFDSSLYDPLSITCLYGSNAMLCHILDDADLNTPEDAFLPGTVFKAAEQTLLWGDLARLPLIWESKAGHQLRNFEFFKLVLEQWSRSPADKHRAGWQEVFRLLEYKGMYNEMVEDHWGAKLVGKAARVGCLPVVQQLFEAAQARPQLMSELLDLSESNHGLLGAAILENHVDVVECLLRQPGIETHICCENVRGENILHLASRFCNPTVFGRLVPLLKERVWQRDSQGDTVLTRIVISSGSTAEDRHEAVRVVLAEVGDRRIDELKEALDAARLIGDEEMCQLLGRKTG